MGFFLFYESIIIVNISKEKIKIKAMTIISWSRSIKMVTNGPGPKMLCWAYIVL